VKTVPQPLQTLIIIDHIISSLEWIIPTIGHGSPPKGEVINIMIKKNDKKLDN
jgi:hypothetical protein